MAKAEAKVWVLTYEINDYNQEGEYFLAVFGQKPSHEALALALRGRQDMPTDIMAAVALLEHVLKGGGRRDVESVWYYLREEELK